MSTGVRSMYPHVVLVSVSGLIGVGKSTAVKALKSSKLVEQRLAAILPASEKEVHVIYVSEPSDQWRSEGWLSGFYADPEKRALAFQLLVFATHVEAVQEALKPFQADAARSVVVCFVERCMYDQLLFWKVQGTDSMDDDAYMRIWRRWHSFIPPVSTIFYCRTSDIQKTMLRVEERARHEEMGTGVTLEYQTKLDKKHKDWYGGGGGMSNIRYGSSHAVVDSIPCVQIDMDSPIHSSQKELASLAYVLCKAVAPHVIKLLL